MTPFSSSHNPKISVLLANYNHAAVLRDCVEGIVKQTYPNWELILVDDGSQDRSPQLIRHLCETEKRIRPMFMNANRGALAALHSGYSELSGDLFLAVAADDYLSDPTFFATAVCELELRPNASGVFGRCRVVSWEDGRELWTMGGAPKEGLNDAVSAITSFFANTIFIPGASAIWKLPLVREAGFFDPQLGPQSDFYLNHALAATQDGAIYLPNVVAHVRFSPVSFSRSVSTNDFFRRHALVEAKMRALPSSSGVSVELYRKWRWAVINARLGATYQRPVYQAARESADATTPNMRDNLPSDFLDVVARCASLEQQLDAAIGGAAAIFDQIAGPLDGPPF